MNKNNINAIETNLVTADGLRPVVIEFDSIIRSITDCTHTSNTLMVPGYIDLHNHGANGFDVMQGYEGIIGTARFHRQNGTLAMAPTTMTAQAKHIATVLTDIARIINEQSQGLLNDLPIILGAHLEGPFINNQALGAQPDFCLKPSANLIYEWQQLCPITITTMAPELEEALLVATILQLGGTRVQIGHTKCTCSQANIALTTGFSGFTHLFNAMTALHHRKAGALGCALAYGEFAEIICDGIHIERDAFMAARRAIPHCYAVTDSTAATGMEDGVFPLGAHRVTKQGNHVLLDDGTLAGSAITMHDAFRQLVRWGVPLFECIQWCCHRPARYIGQSHLTRLDLGSAANFNIIDGESLDLRQSMMSGKTEIL